MEYLCFDVNSYLVVLLDKLLILRLPYRPYHHHICHQLEVGVVGKLEVGLLEGGVVGQEEVLVGFEAVLVQVVVVVVVHQELVLVPALGQGQEHQGQGQEPRHLRQLEQGHLLLLVALDLGRPCRLDPGNL